MDRDYAKVEHHRNFADFINLISLRSIRTRNSGNRFVFRFQSKSSLPKFELQTTLQWFHSFLLDFWVNPTRMGRRGSAKQRAAPLCTFAEADQSGIFFKGREQLTEGGSRNEGGGKLPLRRQLRFLVASFWRLASQVGGLVRKLPSESGKSLSIIGRNGGEGGPPYFNGKGESPFHSRSSTTTFRPT